MAHKLEDAFASRDRVGLSNHIDLMVYKVPFIT